MLAIAPACQKCKKICRPTFGSEIYPHRPDLHEKNFYICDGCGGYVGCHKGTLNPLGTPADAELRRARNLIHQLIDPIWKDRKKGKGKARAGLYQYIALKLNISGDDCHVGMFDIDRCRTVWHLMKDITYQDISDYLNSKGR